MEAPDEPLISIRQLAKTSADYLPSTHPLTLSDKQTANRLGTFLANWKLITTDRWVLHAVSGYKIPFLSPPHHWRAGPKVFREGRPRELMKESIQSLISRGAISVVDPCPEQLISTLFLVQKGPGTGEFRPVINLEALIRFLPKEKFKMEGLHSARSLLRRGDFMMKIDFKDAYYAVPIHPESRKYLRFYLLPCGMNRSVGSTFTLQSPATPAGSATPPVWVATQVSDKFVSTIPGGPEVVGVVESTLSHLSGHHPTPFDLTIRTDASLLGWGATCNGRTTGGRWSVGEAEQHINGLELEAATLALKSFLGEGMKLRPQTLDPSPPQHILLEMDNTTAVTYVNRGGGHSIPFSVPAGLGTVVFPVDQGSVGNSPSPTKGVECGGRHSFTGVQRTNRKDAAEKSLPGHKFVTSMFPR